MEFSTKKEALEFATKRRKNFREIIRKGKYHIGDDPKIQKKHLKEAIKSIKVKKIKLKHWRKPIYTVVGM